MLKKIMECKMSISSKNLEKYMGKKITEEEFARFCKDAVIEKLWKQQIINPPAKQGTKQRGTTNNHKEKKL